MFGLVAFLCACLTSLPASAERGERRGYDRPGERYSIPQDRRGAEREAAREERRERRMSEEQRQQLRRDIDEAGRDIYRRYPRRFRDQ